MASVEEQLRNSVLSAENIRELTRSADNPNGWPDQLILDYLTIIQNLIELASNLDVNIADVTNNSQLIAPLYSAISKIQSKIKTIKTPDNAEQLISPLYAKVAKLDSIDKNQQKQINNAVQLSVSW